MYIISYQEEAIMQTKYKNWKKAITIDSFGIRV